MARSKENQIWQIIGKRYTSKDLSKTQISSLEFRTSGMKKLMKSNPMTFKLKIKNQTMSLESMKIISNISINLKFKDQTENKLLMIEKCLKS